MNAIAGSIEQRADGFYYVGESGNWFRIRVWVEDDEFHIANDDLSEQYSIKGQNGGVARVPTKEATR